MKQYKFLLVLVLLVALASCKKQIDYAPKNATYDAIFWNSSSNANQALAGAYGLLRDAMRNGSMYFICGDLPAGSPNTGSEFSLDGSEFWNYQSLIFPTLKYSYTPYLEGQVKDWTNFYKVINQCHLIVENVPAIPDAKFDDGAAGKAQLIAQAKFLRAYTYFYITRIWGDPVITKEALKDPANVQPIARSTETETLAYCIEQAKEAAAGLDFSNDKTSADKGAAFALLAHLFAWQHDYTNTALYCDSVINSGQYSLEDTATYKNIWQGNSAENIFEMYMRFDQATKEANADFFGIFLSAPFIHNKEDYQAWLPNADYVAEVYPNAADARLTSFFTQSSEQDLLLSKYSNADYYDANQPEIYVVSNNLVLFRLADILLLKAEAASKSGNDAAAQEAVNAVRARAGLEPTTATGQDLFAEVFAERQRELFGEGCLAYDAIRMEKLTMSQDRIAQKGYYWPLDMRTLLPQDNLLTQNPYWKSH